MGKNRRHNTGGNTMSNTNEAAQSQDEQLEPIGQQEGQEVIEGGEDAALGHDENSHDESFAITNSDEQAGEEIQGNDLPGEKDEAEELREEPAGDPAALNPGVQDQSIEPAPESPVVVEQVAETIAQAEQPEQAAEPELNLSDAEVYLARIRDQGEPIQRLALEGIEQFCQRMPPRAPITANAAMAAKRDFLDLLVVILRKEYEEFRRGWSTLLVYFAAHHGDRPTASNYTSLSEYSTNRYLDAWTDDLQAEAYMSLITLLRVTRNAETRKNDAKRIRLEAVAPDYLSDRARDNLVRFYS